MKLSNCAQSPYINAGSQTRVSAEKEEKILKTRFLAKNGVCIKSLINKRHINFNGVIYYILEMALPTSANPLISLVRENVPGMSLACPYVRGSVPKYRPFGGVSWT